MISAAPRGRAWPYPSHWELTPGYSDDYRRARVVDSSERSRLNASLRASSRPRQGARAEERGVDRGPGATSGHDLRQLAEPPPASLVSLPLPRHVRIDLLIRETAGGGGGGRSPAPAVRGRCRPGGPAVSPRRAGGRGPNGGLAARTGWGRRVTPPTTARGLTSSSRHSFTASEGPKDPRALII